LPTKENENANDQPAIIKHQLPQTKEKDRKTKAGNVLSNEKTIIIGSNISIARKGGVRKVGSENNAIPKSAGKSNSEVPKTNNLEKKTETHLPNTASNVLVGEVAIAHTDIAKSNLQDENKIIDQKVNETIITDSAITTESKADEAIAATKKKQPASKIKWGIDLSAGKSANRNDAFTIFDMNKSMAMDYLNSPGNVNSGGGPVNYRISPSDIKAGPAFRAGLLGEINISKRSSISSGLQYVYFSNKIQVGYYSDTTVTVNNSFSQYSRVNAVYRGTHQEEYINRYHFIQIPLQYQLQLNKGLKLPILWNIGASAGYLFATNGLVYDTTAGGIYYRDNAAFNKFQFNLNTGFSFRFGNKSNPQWSLGPELSLGMNKLMKDEYTKKQYLGVWWIDRTVVFQKKK
jgi:hypothetical protein